MVSVKKKSFDLPTDGTIECDNYSSDSESDESPKFYQRRKLTAEKMKSKVHILYFVCMRQ